MVVYIDIVFLLNGLINYLLLISADALSGRHPKRLRCILAALLGALYSVLALLPATLFLNKALPKIAVGLLMALIAFGAAEPRAFLRRTALFFAASFVFGGCALAIALLSGSSVTASPKVLLITLCLCYSLMTLCFKRLAQHGGINRDTIELFIRRGSRSTALTALIDTGNTLTDPISGNPVVVAELQALTPLFRDCPALTPKALAQPLDALQILGGSGFRLIPFRTVGTPCGFLLAFRPDEMKIGGVSQPNALVALSSSTLSDGAGFGAICGAFHK